MTPANPKYFIDTNILIYAHDREAGRKHERDERDEGALLPGRLGERSHPRQ